MPDPLAPASVTMASPSEGDRLAKPEHDPETSTGPGRFSLRERAHDLKCWPPHWEAIDTGQKTFDIRINDRGYRSGDLLILREWDPQMPCAEIGLDGPFTGRVCQRVVTHVMTGGQFGLAVGYVALSLQPPAVTR